MQPYSDPIIRKYQQLITETMEGVFRGVYQGDPVRVPKSMLPALIISKSMTQVGKLTNTEDEQGQQLILTVITDIRDEVNDDTQIAPGIAQLYDIIEGREEDTYKLKSNCILNILRSNELVDAAHDLRTDLGTITKADYGLTIGKRDREAYAVEGQVEFVAYFTQLRS